MIVILSKAIEEKSTNKLIDVLSYYRADFVRINGKDILNPGNFSFDLFGNFNFKNFKLDHNKVNVVFNRRWYDDEDFNIFGCIPFLH